MVDLRLDSWDAERGTSQGADLADEPTADVDCQVETSLGDGVGWDTPVPAPARPHEPVGVIDGVRRVHARLFAEDGDTTVPVLAGSWAVGVLYAGADAALGEVALGRELIVGGNLDLEPLEVVVGEATLRFRPRPIPETEPLAVLNELQQTMRRSEAEFARRVAEERPGLLLVRDGPLAFGTDDPVLGLIKQTMRQYLPPTERALLARLRVGERTPVFALADMHGERRRRWSFYMRLADRLPVEGATVGVARMELSEAVPLKEAREIIARAQASLPRLSSDRLRDGRAPQNLYPIGALEEQLHRRLGARDLVYRRLVGRVCELAQSAPRTMMSPPA